jgi:hypothetical protein
MLRFAWFTVWFAAVSIPLAYAGGLHLLPLPRAAISTSDTLPTQQVSHTWQLIHVLAAGCRCSQVVSAHLASRGPLPNASERVWIVGHDRDTEAALTSRGFQVETVDAQDLARRTGIQGAPWLIVVDPAGRDAYCGGYADHPLRAPDDPRESEVLRRLRLGESVTAYPAFGCATAAGLQHAIDPLGLKYPPGG